MSLNTATTLVSATADIDFSTASSLQRGREAFDKNEFSEAVGLFSLTLLSEPSNADALRARAEAYFRLEEYQKSLNDATQLLATAPDDIAMLCRRGTILAMSGNFDLAMTDLSRLLRLEPDHVEGRLRRYWVNMQERQLHAAEGLTIDDRSRGCRKRRRFKPRQCTFFCKPVSFSPPIRSFPEFWTASRKISKC